MSCQYSSHIICVSAFRAPACMYTSIYIYIYIFSGTFSGNICIYKSTYTAVNYLRETFKSLMKIYYLKVEFYGR